MYLLHLLCLICCENEQGYNFTCVWTIEIHDISNHLRRKTYVIDSVTSSQLRDDKMCHEHDDIIIKTAIMKEISSQIKGHVVAYGLSTRWRLIASHLYEK